MTLPVFWTPDADADLKEAQGWYEGIRPNSACVSAWRSRPRLKQSQGIPYGSCTEDGGGRGFGDSRTEFSSRWKSIGLL